MSAGKTDVLILGGGVIGLCCAHYLLQAGRSVRVLERGHVGGATSHGNCGTITPSHAPPLASPGMLLKAFKWMLSPGAPLYIKPRADAALATWLLQLARRCNARDWHQTAHAKGALLGASRALLATLIDEQKLECGFLECGLRYVYRDPGVFARECVEREQLLQFGVASEVMDGDQLAEAEPALLPGLAGAIHFPGDAHLRPEQFTRELARIVRAAGGIIEEGVCIQSLQTTAGRVASVITDDGVREGSEVLVALGPWTAPLLDTVGVHLPIQPGKGYSRTYSRPALAPKVPIVLRERSVCVTAWEDGFRLGSTMEFSGFDSAMNPVRLDALVRAATRYLREPTGPVKQEDWFGWRPMTVDDLPILGDVPGWKNLWLATGHGMMGMGLSAVTGHLLADLISGKAPVVDPASTRLQRFG